MDNINIKENTKKGHTNKNTKGETFTKKTLSKQ
jgi:hypothetical protein